MTEEQKQSIEKSEVALREEKILEFWRENKIFEKSMAQREGNGQPEFVFYDGPPFASGPAHYGHMLTSTIKDVLPRYQTMKGRLVRRRWGWDCHGLPVENLIEKELGLKSKKDIEEYGVQNFNEKARASVLRYAEDWRGIIRRLGRFVDLDHDYKTMDSSYSESVWWVFKTLHEKGLVYQGYKSMQICPRCETTLSNFEVNLGYKDITDISVYVKFKVNPVKKASGLSQGDFHGAGDTYLLAWTTTPWTLPGNVVLAVGSDIDYVKVKIENDFYVLAKARLADSLGEKKYEIIEEFKGVKLVGLEYEPLFNYYQSADLANKENGWKVYSADFVTVEDGTGIVHVAPAFGEDDMELGKREKLPFIQHVTMSGHFKPEVKDFTDLFVKPKDDHQRTDIEVIKYLAGRGELFDKKKIIHSYPHCWRCDTPLLNYATTAWFVEVTKFRDELVANNKTISWVPEHVKEGRFGKWLEGAKDWAVSRSRYWGAPIPAWQCLSCGKTEIIGSIAELEQKTIPPKNKYILMRHGEAQSNLTDTISCQVSDNNPLTEEGRKQVENAAGNLIEKVDLIIYSDFERTKETAAIVGKELGLSDNKLISDERLREINVGSDCGLTWTAYLKRFKNRRERFEYEPASGESMRALRRRAADFLAETDKKYAGKNILIVSHGLTLFFLDVVARGLNADEVVQEANWSARFQNACLLPMSARSIPRNLDGELDLHRPYIDRIVLPCECGGNYERVPDVFDCWFESGSMPYGQAHYPFGDLDVFDPASGVGFPAEFIGEGLDQTRGWFYSLLVLSTALFGKTCYENVVVNGLILAEDGQKMSKRLRNYPDLAYVLDRYGADALRFYLLSSPVVRAEDMNFSEKGVGETQRKIISRLGNTLAFYELYKEGNIEAGDGSKNVLDRWIVSRLAEAVSVTGKNFDRYELDRALREMDNFIDDLSNWYLRRSRDRFRGEDSTDSRLALATLRYVLLETAKMIAPITPFLAEYIYGSVKSAEMPISIHLTDWPVIKRETDSSLVDDMAAIRKVVEIGHFARRESGYNVRQPLAKAIYFGPQLKNFAEVAQVAAEELNIKELIWDGEPFDQGKMVAEGWITKSDASVAFALWAELTPELEREGQLREFIRLIQDLRKQGNLLPGEPASISVDVRAGGLELLEGFASETKKATNCDIAFGKNDGEELEIGGTSFSLALLK